MSEEYYLRNKNAGFCGNAPFWYAKNGNGYTSYILGAERFSKEDAERFVREDDTKWEMFKCDDVDQRLHLIFDMQDVKRLGTDEPCGWRSGYAENPNCKDPSLGKVKNIGRHVQNGWIAFDGELYSPDYYEIKEKVSNA